ncbi:MAG: ABC transporter permease subunit [Actinomycetales bacterium]|nr:ABC transporter permease subunit [Actinomycetales bacterium]
MTNTLTITRKELLDVRRNRFLLVVLAFVLIAVVISVVVSAGQFRVKLDEYTAYVSALTASNNSATPPPPQLFPLQLLRGSVEYLEILGALFAIVLGHGAIAKEKQRATLQLIYTRPVGRFALPAGKLLALAMVWAIAVTAVFVTVLATLAIVGHATFAAIDMERLLITALTTWLYLVMWTAIALGLAALTKRLSTALIIGLVLWLTVVLLLPQIGDTMDPDNQVPGGLFASLQIAKPDEKAVLAHFSAFDTARNALEVSSVTKHFERFTFAVLGIKDQFNQQPLGVVWAGVWNNAVSLWVAALAALGFAFATTTRTALMRRTS